MKILFAGYSTRGFVESARAFESGHDVVALDYFGDADQALFAETYSLRRDFGFQVFSAGALVSAAAQIEFDALVYTSGLESGPDAVRSLSKGKKLFGNTWETLQWLKDVRALFGTLSQNGIDFPATAFPGQAIPGDDWLVKPVSRGGGAGIRRGKRGDPIPPGCIAQKYERGCPASVAFVADGSKGGIIGLSEQLIGREEFGAGGFTYNGNIIPLECQDLEEKLGEIQRMVDCLTSRYHLVGLNGIDFLLVPGGGLLFLELNPRYSASMELYRIACGIDIFRLHLDGCSGAPIPRDLYAGRRSAAAGAWGKAVVYAPWDVTVGETGGWFKEGIRDIPHTGERIPRSAPVCTVFAEGGSRDDCLGGLIEKSAFVLRSLRAGEAVG